MIRDIFIFLSVLALFSAVMTVFARNLVHSILYLILMFLCHCRSLPPAECRISGHCKHNRLCRSHHGAFPVCRYAAESQQDKADHPVEDQPVCRCDIRWNPAACVCCRHQEKHLYGKPRIAWF